MKMKKWWIACILVVLAVMTSKTVSADTTDKVIYRDCVICGGTAIFERVRYGGNYYIDNVPCHVGYYKCHLGHGEELAYLDDHAPHSGGTATCTKQAECEVCGTPYGALAAHVLEPREAKAPTCTQKGWEAYEACINCDYNTRVYISALEHDIEKVEKKNPSCTEAGYEAYWKCKTCGTLFSDEDGTTEISNPEEIKATHDLEKAEKKNPSCTEAGYEAYWKCRKCGALFSDEAGTEKISKPKEIKATGHSLNKVEKQAATAKKEGNIAYWFCDKCNTYFKDEKAETEIKKEDTVLAKLAPAKKKGDKGSKKTADKTKVTGTTAKTTISPATGDNTDMQVYVLLMLASTGVAAGVGIKRKFR